MKDKIVVICPYPKGLQAGQRLKFEQYYSSWESAGYTLEVYPFFSESIYFKLHKKGNYVSKAIATLNGYMRRFNLLTKLTFGNNDSTILYIHQWVVPFGGCAIEKLFLGAVGASIYDIEDYIFSTKHDRGLASRIFRPTRKYLFLIKKSSYVITSSPHMNERCVELNELSSATFISSSVDLDRFVNVGNDNATLTLGWTGTFSTMQYLYLIQDVLKEISVKRRVKLVVISNSNFQLNGVDVENLSWADSTEIRDLSRIDIGLYPLANDEWVMGKSGLKAIQYMALGIPTVASNLGTTPKIIKDKVSGMLCDSQDDWKKALLMLIDDSELRSKIGREGRNTVEKHYSTRAITNEYLQILNKLKNEEQE